MAQWTLLRVGCLGLLLLFAPHAAFARTTASLSLSGYGTTCGVDTPLLNESSPVSVSDGLGPITMPCDDGATDTVSMHAQARAHPDTPPDIAVVASSTGLGASAAAIAQFDDFAAFSPPFGSPVLDLTFSITSPYSLDLSLPTADSSGAALVQLTIPLYAFVEKHLTDAGSSSGTLDTGDITIAGCPCTVEIVGLASVRGSNGGGGSARDPFTIHLPEGWTYTLASEEQAVPEPGSDAMGAGILAAAAVGRSWRVRRTRSRH